MVIFFSCPIAAFPAWLLDNVRVYSDVYELQDVSTHVPVPELVSERVACTLDCRQLNRDTCWLEANRCGECLEGFIGKAGHANSLCGKVSKGV